MGAELSAPPFLRKDLPEANNRCIKNYQSGLIFIRLKASSCLVTSWHHDVLSSCQLQPVVLRCAATLPTHC